MKLLFTWLRRNLSTVCLYFVSRTKRELGALKGIRINVLFRKTAMHLDADLPPAKSKTKI